SNPLSLAPPRWEVDPHFDRSFHSRYLKANGERTLRAVLNMAQVIAMQGFDRARPLWEFYVIDDLVDGSAVLVMKIHHSISDGVGMVKMTSSMVETYRDADPERAPKPMPPAPPAHVLGPLERFWHAFAYERERQVVQARRAAGALGRGLL